MTEELPLALAGTKLCQSPARFAPSQNAEAAALWVSDWQGFWAGRVPRDVGWWAADWVTGRRFRVEPAIVHAMRSKAALEAAGKGLL